MGYNQTISIEIIVFSNISALKNNFVPNMNFISGY